MLEYDSQAQGLIKRLNWLIKLRWLAVGGVFFTAVITSRVLKLSCPALPLYAIAVMLGVYNLIFCVVLFDIEKKRKKDLFPVANRIANLQISLDLTCLAILLHFAGGIENPFVFYFIFHTIIASILLTRRAAFMQATYAIFLFLLVVGLEYSGILPHYCLKKILPDSLHGSLVYIVGVSFAFISTLYISAYMATSISSELRERSRGLIEANKLLKENDRIKSEYVLKVSHDIKEDLAAIQSCIEPVTDGITGRLNKQQNNLLVRAKDRSKSLIRYVNALLEITKLKLVKQLKMEYFSFVDIMKDIEEYIVPRAKDKEIKFVVKVMPDMRKIKGVPVYLKEAMVNLLMNAVKYTSERGRIELEAREERNSLLIRIEDTGMGIPEDEIEYIFDELFRAKNARKISTQGTGLGLAITRQIIDMHKGEIWVSSREGKGTAFFVEIPV